MDARAVGNRILAMASEEQGISFLQLWGSQSPENFAMLVQAIAHVAVEFQAGNAMPVVEEEVQEVMMEVVPQVGLAEAQQARRNADRLLVLHLNSLPDNQRRVAIRNLGLSDNDRRRLANQLWRARNPERVQEYRNARNAARRQARVNG